MKLAVKWKHPITLFVFVECALHSIKNQTKKIQISSDFFDITHHCCVVYGSFEIWKNKKFDWTFFHFFLDHFDIWIEENLLYKWKYHNVVKSAAKSLKIPVKIKLCKMPKSVNFKERFF